ncbi:MAG: hypothetical protein ACI4Q6_00455 [Huintestinicola sp.]
MTSQEKKKITEFERDIKKMKKDHKMTFREFNQKKSLPARIADRLRMFKKQ